MDPCGCYRTLSAFTDYPQTFWVGTSYRFFGERLRYYLTDITTVHGEYLVDDNLLFMGSDLLLYCSIQKAPKVRVLAQLPLYIDAVRLPDSHYRMSVGLGDLSIISILSVYGTPHRGISIAPILQLPTGARRTSPQVDHQLAEIWNEGGVFRYFSAGGINVGLRMLFSQFVAQNYIWHINLQGLLYTRTLNKGVLPSLQMAAFTGIIKYFTNARLFTELSLYGSRGNVGFTYWEPCTYQGYFLSTGIVFPINNYEISLSVDLRLSLHPSIDVYSVKFPLTDERVADLNLTAGWGVAPPWCINLSITNFRERKPAPVEIEKSIIAGRIIDAATNEPLPSAAVTLFRGNLVIRSMNADTEGYFAFDNLEAGDYEIEVRKTNYVPLRYPISIGEAEKLRLTFSLNRKVSAHLTIKVFDMETQQPLSATVKIDNMELISVGGEFTLALEPGSHTILVSSPDYVRGIKKVTVAAGETLKISFYLSKIGGDHDRGTQSN